MTPANRRMFVQLVLVAAAGVGVAAGGVGVAAGGAALLEQRCDVGSIPSDTGGLPEDLKATRWTLSFPSPGPVDAVVVPAPPPIPPAAP